MSIPPPQRVMIRIAGQSDGVNFTATTKEVGKFGLQLAEHPVERGAPVLDHARPQLVTLSLEGIVSDLSDGPGAAQTALTFFVSLYNTPQVVEIHTPRIFYDSMLMQSLEVSRKREEGMAQRFVLEFKQFRVANTKKTTINVVRGRPDQKGPQQNDVALPAPLQSTAAVVNDQSRAAGGVGNWVGNMLQGKRN